MLMWFVHINKAREPDTGLKLFEMGARCSEFVSKAIKMNEKTINST